MAGIQARVAHEGRQVQCEESRMEAADEIAPGQEMKGRVHQGLAHREAQGLRAAMALGLAAQKPGQGQRRGHHQRQQPQRACPIHMGDRQLAAGHHQELAQRAAGAGNAHGRAAVGRRHGARDDGEGRAGLPMFQICSKSQLGDQDRLHRRGDGWQVSSSGVAAPCYGNPPCRASRSRPLLARKTNDRPGPIKRKAAASVLECRSSYRARA